MPAGRLTRLLAPPVIALLAAVAPSLASGHYQLLTIEGEPLVGRELEARVAGQPPGAGLALQWQRKRTDAAAWQDIPGAQGARHRLARGDEGHLLRVRAGAAVSNPTDVVQAIPVADEQPSWAGIVREGESLAGHPGVWWGTEPISLFSGWVRCGPDGFGCTLLEGTTAPAYTVTAADVGYALRVRTLATNPAGAALADSPPTGPVVARDVPADPGGSFSDAGEPPAVPPVTAPADPAVTPPFIRPFPLIRVAGRFQGRRTRVTLVRVRAPRGVVIEIRCRGRGCPYGRRAIASRVTRLRPLERTLFSRTTIVFRVTRAGHIGKYTKIRFRANQAPARADRCLMPGSREPVRCPSA